MTDTQRTSPPTLTVTVDTLANISKCTAVRWEHYSGGEMRIPAGAAYTSLQPYTAGSETGTYQIHDDEGGASGAIAVTAGRNQPSPVHLYAAKWVKFVGTAAGTFEIDRKS